MVVQAVKENRPMVVTDRSTRRIFHDAYVLVVDEAFDFVDRFDKAPE
jgi:hypothetical protein